MKNLLFPVAAILAVTTVFMLGLSPAYVAADEYGQGGAQSWDDKDKSAGHMSMGTHSMGATVESIDHKTGFLKLKSGLGEMTIHFPAPTVKDLNKGDKINVNLSYTKDDEKMSHDGAMKMK